MDQKSDVIIGTKRPQTSLKLLSIDTNLTWEEVTERKRTFSPRKSDKVVSLSVCCSSGVNWFLLGLSFARLKGVAYSLNLDILAE